MLLSRWRWHLGAALLAVLASLALLTRATSAPAPPPSSAPAREQPTTRRERALPEVRTLLQQDTSAFHARLFADDDAVILATESGFTTLRGAAPPEHHAHELGPVVARQRDGLVFWRSKWLRAVSLAGDGERELVPLPAPPRYLLATGERLAWISAGPDERAAIQALSGGAARTLLEETQPIVAAALGADALYWVSRARDGAWTIRRVGFDGQPPASSAPQRGRPPSQLALGPGALYYYDGPQRGVRQLTLDLQREAAVLPGAICSPLAAGSRLLCAQVGGLFELPQPGARPRFLASERGPITTLALTHQRAYWVADAAMRGRDALVLRSLDLP